MMLIICSHEQMVWCECHVNNVLQSVIWGNVVRTVRIMTHGRRLKVSYDLPEITHRPCNLMRLEDTLCCYILKYYITVSTWLDIGGENITTQQLTFITILNWCPVCLLFLVVACSESHFVCWLFQSIWAKQQWIEKCICIKIFRYTCLLLSLSALPHKIERNCEMSRQAQTLRGWGVILQSHRFANCQTLPPCGNPGKYTGSVVAFNCETLTWTPIGK